MALRQPVTLRCRATGTPPPRLGWRKDGVPLPATGSIFQVGGVIGLGGRAGQGCVPWGFPMAVFGLKQRCQGVALTPAQGRGVLWRGLRRLEHRDTRLLRKNPALGLQELGRGGYR